VQDCDGASPSQTCTLLSPRPPREIITREPQCQHERRASYPAFHNIIPSELCNSRRHRQCPASREEVSRGQKPAKTAYRASDYTIRIMLRTLRQCGAEVLPSNSRVRRRQTSSPPQGPPASRPVGGLRTLRSFVEPSVGIRAALHPQSAKPPATSASRLVSKEGGMPGRKVPSRTPSVLLDRLELAGDVSAVREVCRLMQLRCGSARYLQSCVAASAPHHFRHRSSKVRLRRVHPGPLFLHTSAGKNPAGSVPGSPGAAVPAAGAACTHRYQDAKVIP